MTELDKIQNTVPESTSVLPEAPGNTSEIPSDATISSGQTSDTKIEPKKKPIDAFSRRATNSLVASSVYTEQSEEKPAWMRDPNANKYDKYGQRPATIRAKVDDRRLKRRQEEEPQRRQANIDSQRHSSQHELPVFDDNDEPAPYNNLDAANPAAVPHGTVQAKRYRTFQSNINKSADQNSIIRSHYNQRAHQSKTQGARTDSPIIKLRNFNNAIKYILLGNFALKASTILDLCCGKGGDLNKCEFVGVDQYIGIDISDASVKEAFSRYNRSKARFIQRGEQRDSRKLHFEACFATGDCFGTSVPEILEPSFPGIIEKIFPVDCVSIQFALHYAFESEEKVDSLLINVTKSLRSGGTFVGTIPSSDFIRKKIVNKEFFPGSDVKFGNELYSVTFEKPPPADGVFRPPFGNKYMYSLKDAIDDVPEYMVPFETLRAKCEEYGLVLKYKKNFIDIFNEEIPKYFTRLNKKLVDGMKRSDGKYGVEGEEKEATAFYVGFVFEKL